MFLVCAWALSLPKYSSCLFDSRVQCVYCVQCVYVFSVYTYYSSDGHLYVVVTYVIEKVYFH